MSEKEVMLIQAGLNSRDITLLEELKWIMNED